jgi:hypothetical protein
LSRQLALPHSGTIPISRLFEAFLIKVDKLEAAALEAKE